MSRAMSYIGDFGLTLVVELPIVVAVARSLGIRWQRAIGGALLANVVTHPLLWFVAGRWLQHRFGDGGLLLAEAAVVVVEAAVYARWFGGRIGRALAGWLALLANAASLAIGLLVHRALH